MRISKNMVIETASDLADVSGLSSVSLKAVAEKLGIRTPSLYNHINSLDDLLRAVAHQGMREMNNRMAHSALGKIGDTAIQAVCAEYFQCMIEHPGVYETIQWVGWHRDEETERLMGDYQSLLSTLVLSCGLDDRYTAEIVALLTGMIHGYTTLQLGMALADGESAKADLYNAIDTVLIGIAKKYHSK